MHRALLTVVGVVGLASLSVSPVHAQPSDPLVAKASSQTDLPLHRLGETVTIGDLKVTLVSVGYAPKTPENLEFFPTERRTDPGTKFCDAALHFLVKVRFENTSAGRYIPVEALDRLFAEPRDVERFAMDNWGNTITEIRWIEDKPHRPEPLFNGLNDPGEFKPGGPMLRSGILPPGSTCEIDVELQPPFFIASSQYFLYFQPVVASVSPIKAEKVAFYIPVSQIVMPKEGEYILNTPEFNKRYKQILDESTSRARTGAAPHRSE